MSAIALESPVLRLARSTVPEPLRRLLREAGLAEPPVSLRDVRLDRETSLGGEKTLLTFTADRPELNLFLLLSPALQRAMSTRIEGVASRDRPPPEEGDPDGAERREPHFQWWCPDEHGPGRQYVFSTDEFDYVEVLVTDLTDTVFIRAIR